MQSQKSSTKPIFFFFLGLVQYVWDTQFVELNFDLSKVKRWETVSGRSDTIVNAYLVVAVAVSAGREIGWKRLLSDWYRPVFISGVYVDTAPNAILKAVHSDR